VLHEAAHGICEVLARDDPPHGPAFVRVYVDLLERFTGAVAVSLVELADEYRVRVAESP
jgi:hypothetical protein